MALPEAGQRALAAIDPDEHITSERLRRAARHLAGQIEMPLSAVDPVDDELARVLADLVARAARESDVREEQIEQQRLLLERARLERAIRRARGQPGADVHTLALEREAVLGAIRDLEMRLQAPV
jgi:hypothetical protein